MADKLEREAGRSEKMLRKKMITGRHCRYYSMNKLEMECGIIIEIGLYRNDGDKEYFMVIVEWVKIDRAGNLTIKGKVKLFCLTKLVELPVLLPAARAEGLSF